MQFLIHGADKKTGREMTVVVDARDQSEAEQRVLYNDILISSLAQFANAVPPLPPAKPLIAYNRPEPAAEERGFRTRTPFYKEILRGAKWVAGLAVAIRIVGVLFVILALCAVALPLIKPIREIMPFKVIPLLWFIGGGILLAIGFVCMLCGATVSMFSGLALAVRDIARNSFEEEPDESTEEKTQILIETRSESRQLLPGV